MIPFILQTTEQSNKHVLFDKWDKEIKANKDNYFTYKQFLKDLKDQNNNLYNIACALAENYKSAHLMKDSEANICVFLNEWLDNKRRINTENGQNYENNQLWENYIEELWIQLEKETDRNYWCKRIFPSSPISNALATSFTVVLSIVIIFFLIYKVTSKC